LYSATWLEVLEITSAAFVSFSRSGSGRPTSYHLDSADLLRHGSHALRLAEDRPFWQQIAMAGSYGWTLRMQEGRKFWAWCLRLSRPTQSPILDEWLHT